MATHPALILALCGLAGALAGAAAAPAPAAPEPFLAQLAGDWELVGTVRGQSVRYRGVGRWQLQDTWLQLSLIDQGTPPEYEASVWLGFDAKAGDYVAHWLDKFGAAGARVVASGRRAGQTLVLLFPYPEGAFRDTLTLAAGGHSGSLLIESQDQEGRWSRFASYTLTRVGPAAPAAPAAPATHGKAR